MARALLRQQINSGLVAAPSASKAISDARFAMLRYLLGLTGERTWMEAKFSTVSAGIMTVPGWMRGVDGELQSLASPTSAQTPTIVSTTDGCVGWAKGGGSYTLIGSTNAKLPAPPWSFACVAQQPTGFNGVLFCIDNGASSGQVVIDTSTDNRIQIYSSYTGTRYRTGPNAASLINSPGLVVVEHDGTTITLRINGTAVGSMSGAVATTTAGKIRFGSQKDGSSDYGNVYDGYVEWGITAPVIGAEFRALSKAIALDDHSGWTIA